MVMDLDVSLYLVTDRELSLGRSLEAVVEEAVKGGVTMVQLREKEASSLEFYQLALRLKACLKPFHVPLIINDRIDIALACDAEGVHLGQSDLPVDVARKLLGKNCIIGLSLESVADAEEANRLDVDYVAVSPVYDTSTKTDTSKALGLDGVRAIRAATRFPTVAIGGIHLPNAASIIEAGADGLAVVSAIMSATDPQEAAKELKQIIYHTKNNKTT